MKKEYVKLEVDKQAFGESNTARSIEAEESIGLVSKLSNVVIYHLQKSKYQFNLVTAKELNETIKYYKKSFDLLGELIQVTNSIKDKKFELKCIREDLSLNPNIPIVDINWGIITRNLEHNLMDDIEPISKMLLYISRKAYAKMDDKDISEAASKISKIIKSRTDAKGLYSKISTSLKEANTANDTIDKFINHYKTYTKEPKSNSIKSITKKLLLFNNKNELLLRGCIYTIANYIASEPTPSWPRIATEKSVNGRVTGFSITFNKKSSYWKIIETEPLYHKLSMNLFSMQIDEMIKNAGYAIGRSGQNTFEVLRYDDLGKFLMGKSDFSKDELNDVKASIAKILRDDIT